VVVAESGDESEALPAALAKPSTSNRPREHAAKQVAASAAPPKATHTARLVKTPLGFGMSLDSRSKVVGVTAGSQAARGGVQVGDVIVALDGAPLSGSASAAFGAIAAGDSVTFGLASAVAGSAPEELQLAGTLHKRSAKTGMYKKVKVVIEGTTLCFADFKSDKPSELRGADIERLEVANRTTLEFVLLTKKNGPERGRTHGFRVSTRAEFARWMSGLQQWLDSLPQAI
jgi:membrane-associated protease RseP (regulator of RpoE activity)